jgi:hypothetical protein
MRLSGYKELNSFRVNFVTQSFNKHNEIFVRTLGTFSPVEPLSLLGRPVLSDPSQSSRSISRTTHFYCPLSCLSDGHPTKGHEGPEGE